MNFYDFINKMVFSWEREREANMSERDRERASEQRIAELKENEPRERNVRRGGKPSAVTFSRACTIENLLKIIIIIIGEVVAQHKIVYKYACFFWNKRPARTQNTIWSVIVYAVACLIHVFLWFVTAIRSVWNLDDSAASNALIHRKDVAGSMREIAAIK